MTSHHNDLEDTVPQLICSGVDGLLVDDKGFLPDLDNFVRELQKGALFSLVFPGSDETQYHQIKDLTPHNYAFLAQGTIITDGQEVNPAWQSAMLSVSPTDIMAKNNYLAHLTSQYSGGGVSTNEIPSQHLYTVSFPERLQATEINRLQSEADQAGLQITDYHNGEHVVHFFPKQGGIANAINHIWHTQGCTEVPRPEQVFGIGCELHDLPMLKGIEGKLFTVENAHSDVKSYVASRDGYVSPRSHTDGFKEIVNYIKPMFPDGQLED